MTRVAYLDCVSGIAGDMLVGALLDAGADIDTLRRLPAQLGLPTVDVAVEAVERQGIGALHVHFGAVDEVHDRSWRAIRVLLEQAELEQAVRDRSLTVFARLAEAEARVHRIEVHDVAFHELGALDTVLDICGVAALFADLGIERVVASPLPLGRGLVRARHGILPLPAPATVELLRGIPVFGVESDVELVTPTGAALAATLADSWGLIPPLLLEEVGYGAGTVDTGDRPNVVRLIVGTADDPAVATDVTLLETNLDDLNPELVPDAVERCFAAGALDVWTAPVQMKKGRPGIVLSALARPRDEGAVASAILEETSALGVRVARLLRYELDREERIVELAGGPVRVKLGRLGGRLVNIAPEHDDCAEIARSSGTSVKSVWYAAIAAAQHE